MLGDSEESNESNWFTTEKINKIKYVHDYLNDNEYIGKVLSLASSIRVAEIVNDDKELNSLEMSLLYKQLPDEVKDIAVNPYLSIKDNEARINVRVLDSNQNLRRADLIKKIKTDLNNDAYLKSEVITITGILLLYNNMLQSLFDSQIKSLGFVMLIIALMFLILFRSLKLMVIGIIPNLLSALLVLGIMGIINLPLDMMTITIAAITVGIAVDNSIHYIYRFKEEFQSVETYEDTVKICHSSIGRFHTNDNIRHFNRIRNACSTYTCAHIAPEITNFYETTLKNLAIPLAMLLMSRYRSLIHVLGNLLYNFSSNLYHRK